MAESRVFSPEVVEKVTRLCRLLADIRIHPLLGSRLVLKGGTALNLFHLGVRRLSVDADLNYVGALEAETAAAERPSILAAMRAVAEGQGYRVRESGLRAVFVAMAGVLPRAVWEYSPQRVERVRDRDIRENLYPVLRTGDRPKREDLLSKVVPWLELWLALDAAEMKFHRRLNEGHLQGTLLFPTDAVLAAAIDQHPGLRWKVLNVAKMGVPKGESPPV